MSQHLSSPRTGNTQSDEYRNITIRVAWFNGGSCIFVTPNFLVTMARVKLLWDVSETDVRATRATRVSTFRVPNLFVLLSSFLAPGGKINGLSFSISNDRLVSFFFGWVGGVRITHAKKKKNYIRIWRWLKFNWRLQFWGWWKNLPGNPPFFPLHSMDHLLSQPSLDVPHRHPNKPVKRQLSTRNQLRALFTYLNGWSRSGGGIGKAPWRFHGGTVWHWTLTSWGF